MTHKIDIHVGKRLKNLRIMRGMTQTDVGKALGISFQQVQKYELGRNRISASKMYDAAVALRVPPSYFFEGTDAEDTTGPAIDDSVAALAGKLSQIKNKHHVNRVEAFVDTIIDKED